MMSPALTGSQDLCNAFVMQRVRDLEENDAELRGEFSYVVRLMSVYTSALTHHGPFTLFMATDAGFHKSLNDTEVYYSSIATLTPSTLLLYAFCEKK